MVLRLVWTAEAGVDVASIQEHWVPLPTHDELWNQESKTLLHSKYKHTTLTRSLSYLWTVLATIGLWTALSCHTTSGLWTALSCHTTSWLWAALCHTTSGLWTALACYTTSKLCTALTGHATSGLWTLLIGYAMSGLWAASTGYATSELEYPLPVTQHWSCDQS